MLRKGTETPKEGDTGKTADWATDWAKEGDTGKTADWATDWVLEKNYLDGSSTLTSSKTDTKLPVPGLEKPKPARQRKERLEKRYLSLPQRIERFFGRRRKGKL